VVQTWSLIDAPVSLGAQLALHIWGGAESGVPLVALVFVREMAQALPSAWLEAVLRGAYKEYAAQCRFVTPSSVPRLAFLAASVAELYSLDAPAAYPHAFMGIRQLALVLRTALTMKSSVSQVSLYALRP